MQLYHLEKMFSTIALNIKVLLRWHSFGKASCLNCRERLMYAYLSILIFEMVSSLIFLIQYTCLSRMAHYDTPASIESLEPP